MAQYVRDVQNKKKKLISLLLASDQSKEREATENEAQVSEQSEAQCLGTIADPSQQGLREFLS